MLQLPSSSKWSLRLLLRFRRPRAVVVWMTHEMLTAPNPCNGPFRRV